MEPIDAILAATRRSVDQQANRGARSDYGATIDPGRLSGSQGVTSFLKVIKSPMLVAARRLGFRCWSSRTHWRLDACFCLILLVLSPAISWLQGQDVNYDARNHHLYASLTSTIVGLVCLWERIIKGRRHPLVLHADNGNAVAEGFSAKRLRAATLEAWLEELGVLRSFSRPRVLNDNPFLDYP